MYDEEEAKHDIQLLEAVANAAPVSSTTSSCPPPTPAPTEDEQQ